MERVEALVGEAERFADPAARGVVRELVASLLELHGKGLARILEIVAKSHQNGSATLAAFADDGLVASLMMLHELHPIDLETRVQKALDAVRPALKGHGGGVELLGVVDGVIRLRLEGNCNGCPSSGDTLSGLVESALDEFAPDRLGLEVSRPEPEPSRMFSLPLLSEAVLGVSR
jgi:Fe-S cluster biogenesis protein NfuA